MTEQQLPGELGKTLHVLKIIPEFYVEVALGNKTAEYGRLDRDFKVGDHLILAEWKNSKQYTGRYCYATISHILVIGDTDCMLSIKGVTSGIYGESVIKQLQEINP